MKKKAIAIVAGALAVTLLSLTHGFAYKSVEVKNGGSIAGKAVFDGEPPKLKPLPITKNRDFCGSSTPDPSLVISPGGEVKNVVVMLEGIGKGKKALPVKGAYLDNKDCIFTPHVQAVTVRTRLEVRNSDPILHNTHTYLRKRTVFNLALPLQGQKIRKRLRRPGLMSTKCDAGHTWMSAYIWVLEHPYYAVSDERGTFSIRDIPLGKYILKAWHEVLGTLRQEVTVPEGGEVKVEFHFKR